MSRTATSILVAAVAGLLLAGCGSSKTTSVRDVERAFADHGQPFQHETVPNPYLRQVLLLSPVLERHGFKRHLRAILDGTNSSTFSVLQVWVFDSPSSVDAALKLIPHWVTGNAFELKQGNLIVVTSKDRLVGVRAALAALK